MVLFPNADFFGTKTRAEVFTAEEITQIRDDSARIYVYGEIEYFDIFDKRQFTRFCYNVAVDSPTRNKLTSNYKPSDLVITFAAAPMGNDAS